MVERFSIGEAANATGVKIPTIRYYEEIGLLPRPDRTEGNRRVYAPEEIRRLIFIRHARGLGFEIDPIRTLLQLQDKPEQSCAGADDIARIRLADVEQRITALSKLREELQRMIEDCEKGEVACCKVIETLNSGIDWGAG